jgi:hypothetical protein
MRLPAPFQGASKHRSAVSCRLVSMHSYPPFSSRWVGSRSASSTCLAFSGCSLDAHILRRMCRVRERQGLYRHTACEWRRLREWAMRGVSVSRRAQDDRDGTSRGLRPVDHVNIDLLLEMALKRMGWKIRFVNVSTTFTTSRYPAKEKEKGPLTIRIREVSVSRRAQDDRDGTSRGLRPVDHVNIDLLLDSLTSCGGCVAYGKGKDCTVIRHANGVGCENGRCGRFRSRGVRRTIVTVHRVVSARLTT